MGQASAFRSWPERQSSVAGISGCGAIREMAPGQPLPRVLDPSIRRQLEPVGSAGLRVPNGGERCGAGTRALRSHKVDRDLRGSSRPSSTPESHCVRAEETQAIFTSASGTEVQGVLQELQPGAMELCGWSEADHKPLTKVVLFTKFRSVFSSEYFCLHGNPD